VDVRGIDKMKTMISTLTASILMKKQKSTLTASTLVFQIVTKTDCNTAEVSVASSSSRQRVNLSLSLFPVGCPSSEVEV
jgi:hypothetical protein